MTLAEILERAREEKWAVPHFNISGPVALRAICEAAKKMGSPVIIGTSEGEQKFIGVRQAVALVRAYKEEYGIPLFLNADHHKSVEAAKEVVDFGYDSVHIDLSKEPWDDNVSGTKTVVEYARASGRDVAVEAELGYLRGSSSVQKEVIEIKPEDMTKVEEAAKFVEATGVNRFAPVVGNIHGIAANEPKLDIGRVAAIRNAVPPDVALVLHGGSGITDEDMRRAIEAGINNIHINTEIRVEYHRALSEFLRGHPDETTPYKFLKTSVDAMRKEIEGKLELFGAVNRL